MKKLISLLLVFVFGIVFGLPNDVFVVINYNVTAQPAFQPKYRMYICSTDQNGSLIPSGYCYGIISIYPTMSTGGITYTFPSLPYSIPISQSQNVLAMLGKVQNATIFNIYYGLYNIQGGVRFPINFYTIPSFGLNPLLGNYVGILFSGNETINIRYIGVGSSSGNILYEVRYPLILYVEEDRTNVTPVPTPNVTCAIPTVRIIQPSNDTIITSGTPFTLVFFVNSTTGYVNYDMYIDDVVYMSGSGMGGERQRTIIISGSGYKTIKVRGYYYCNDQLYEAYDSIRIFLALPPKVWIKSIYPLANITNSIGYLVINSDKVTVEYILTFQNVTIPNVVCKSYFSLISLAENTSGNTYKEIIKNVNITGAQTIDRVQFDLSDMAEGLYEVGVNCTVGGVYTSDSVRVVYGRNATRFSLYCKALGGYYVNYNCCGDEPNEYTPKHVSGYPNATYFVSATCSIADIPAGKCLVDLDCPPSGWICVNETHRGYIQYSCTVNASKIDPTSFGDCVANITKIEACPNGYICTYGICAEAPVTPYLRVNIVYPVDRAVLYLPDLTLNLTFNVENNVADEVKCKILLDGIPVKEDKYFTNINVTEFIPVRSGTNYLTIGCSDINGQYNSSSVTFRVNVGVVFESVKECGIPYVCLNSFRAAKVSYYLTFGRCGFNVLFDRNATTGEYCIQGNIAPGVSINPVKELIGYVCGPDAISIYQVLYSRGSVAMYKVGEAENRCVLGRDVSPVDYPTFHGMEIPVCTDSNTVTVYKIVYDNSTKKLYYEEAYNYTCSNGCVAGICTENLSISEPLLRIHYIPTNVTEGVGDNIVFSVEDQYSTVYVEIYDIVDSKQYTVFKGVVPTNANYTVRYVPPHASNHTIRFIVTNPLGISSVYEYTVEVVSAAAAPGAPGVPPAVGIPPILPTAAAVARELALPIALIILAIIGGILGFLFLRRRR